MQLLLLLIVFLVIGYLLARSKYSKPIDATASKVAKAPVGWWARAQEWWRGRFGKGSKVVDAEAKDVTEAPAAVASEPPADEAIKPAEKSVSRRKAED